MLFSCALFAAEKSVNLSADDMSVEYSGGKPSKAYLSGNVVVISDDYKITGDQGEIDYITNIAKIYDNVKIEKESITAQATSVSLNFKTSEVNALDNDIIFSPDIANTYLDEKLYIRTKSIGRVSSSEYNIKNCDVTGCSLSNPHYILRCKDMVLYPNKRLVLKDVDYFWHGKRLFGIPRVTIPLDERYNDPRTTPKVGYDSNNGYFAKFAYPYNPKNRDAYGLFLIDIMSKKGIGLGVSQDYNMDKYNMNGNFGYYRQINFNGESNDESYNLRHSQKIGRFSYNLGADLSTTYYNDTLDYNTHGYFAAFAYNNGSGNSVFSFRNSYTGGEYSTKSNNYTFNHNQIFSAKYSILANIGLDDYKSGDYERQLLTTNLTLNGKEDVLDWKINALLYDELSHTPVGYSGIEKRPEISLSSDAVRLNILKDNRFNVRFNAGYSDLLLQDKTSVKRSFFEAYVPDYKINISDKSYFNINALYKQMVYSSDAAKYALGTNIYYNHSLGKNSNIRLDYKLQSPRGYSPIQSDYISKYNYTNLRYIYNNTKNLSMELFGGYDFDGSYDNWQDIKYKIKWMPNDKFSNYFICNYDLNGGGFGTFIDQIRYINSDRLSFDLGLRYDNSVNKLTSAKGIINWNAYKDYYMRTYLSYDGYEKQFDYIIGEISKKFHCYDASIVYKRQTGYYSDSSIMFYIKLDIFPDTNEFSADSNGSAIGTGVGDIYF